MSNFEKPNPYAAPVAQPGRKAAPTSKAEDIRNRYLSHEASIQSFGLLYLLGGIFGILLGIGYIVGGIGLMGSERPDDASLAIVLIPLGIFALAISIFQLFVGVGLRKLTPWCRIAGIVLSCIGLLAVPIGTLISGYLLYLLVSEKGQYVFSEQYAKVRAATPHIKYKTSIIVWIFLGILLFFIGLGLIGAVASVFA